MRRLRDRIEANLSRLVGASVAMELMTAACPTCARKKARPTTSRWSNHGWRATSASHRLHGRARRLRRFYRDTLQDLPLA